MHPLLSQLCQLPRRMEQTRNAHWTSRFALGILFVHLLALHNSTNAISSRILNEYDLVKLISQTPPKLVVAVLASFSNSSKIGSQTFCQIDPFVDSWIVGVPMGGCNFLEPCRSTPLPKPLILRHQILSCKRYPKRIGSKLAHESKQLLAQMGLCQFERCN